MTETEATLHRKTLRTTGLARLRCILMHADPEPVEFGNLFFLVILVATYLPNPRALLYDPLRITGYGLLATLALLLLPLAFYAIIWQPSGYLRRMTLVCKATIWTIIGVAIYFQAGALTIRTAFCVALMLSSLWAAYRVGSSGGAECIERHGSAGPTQASASG